MELFAKKSLGQHFLTSTHALGEIISAAALMPGERVLEIGPGTGILTRALLDAGARVTAVEKDDRAYDLLQKKFSVEIGEGKLILEKGDVLQSDISIPEPFALVANIPYYITGAILERFLEHGPRPDRMVLLVQKEVADRIVGEDGKESILSVSVKAFGTPKIIAKVPRGAFTPPPKVDSAILAIRNVSDVHFRERNLGTERFFNLVRAGFAHKRKFLIRNLESVARIPAIQAAWQKLELNPKARAEDISTEMWLKLAILLLK